MSVYTSELGFKEGVADIEVLKSGGGEEGLEGGLRGGSGGRIFGKESWG